MADNTAQNGTATIATDDVGGVHYQWIKVAVGAPDVAVPVTSAAPFPVNLASSGGNNAGTSQTLSAAAAAPVASTANSTSQAVLDISNMGNVGVYLSTAAFVGTLTFEVSPVTVPTVNDWVPIDMAPINANYSGGSAVALSIAAQTARIWETGVLTPKWFKVRCSAFTSGTAPVTIGAGPGWIDTTPMTQTLPPAGFTFATVTTSSTAGGTAVAGLAADASRKGVTIWNDHASGNLCVALGFTATATNYNLEVPPQGYYEVPAGFVTASVSLFSTVASVPARIGTAV